MLRGDEYQKLRAEFLELWYKTDKSVTDNIRMNELEDELERIEREEAK